MRTAQLVSFDPFVALMNEELARHPRCPRGFKVVIVNNGGGYDLIGTDDEIAKSVWSKEAHDIVSSKYKITVD